MLTDSYVEQAFKAKPSAGFYLKVFICIVLIAVGMACLCFVDILIGFVVFVVGAGLLCVFWGERKLEYEYILTNGKVDIAAIYNASRRKEKKQFELEQVTMIVPKDSQRIAAEHFSKKFDYTSGRGEFAEIALVLEETDKKQLILMEPNEKTMEHIRRYAKLKIHDM